MINHTLKPIACLGGCGKQVQYKTSPKVFCPDCRKARMLARARENMAKVRIAKGIEPVKGTVIPCSACGASFMRTIVKQVRCKDCQRTSYLLEARRKSEERRSSEAGRSSINEWARKSLINRPDKRVTSHMRTMIHRALGKKKAGKSWRTFVDYSLEELMSHLERQFMPGMTWENKGEWHIDHIVPRSDFEYASADDEEFKRAWALSNRRPMWAKDNIRKNATRTHLI